MAPNRTKKIPISDQTKLAILIF